MFCDNFHWVRSISLDTLYATTTNDRSYNMDMIWDIRMHYNLIFTHICISTVIKSCAHITSNSSLYVMNSLIHEFTNSRICKLFSMTHVPNQMLVSWYRSYSKPFLVVFTFDCSSLIPSQTRYLPVPVKKSWTIWPSESLESTKY